MMTPDLTIPIASIIKPAKTPLSTFQPLPALNRIEPVKLFLYFGIWLLLSLYIFAIIRDRQVFTQVYRCSQSPVSNHATAEHTTAE